MPICLPAAEEYLEPYLDVLRDAPGSNAVMLLPSPRALGPGTDALKQLS